MNVISRSCEIMTTSYIEDEIKNKKSLSTDEVTTSVRRSRVTSPNNKKEDKNNHSNTAKEDNRDQMSTSERSQRRKARIRERRKEGRSRTLDFSELRKPIRDANEKKKLSNQNNKIFDNKNEVKNNQRKENYKSVESEENIYNRMSSRQSNLMKSAENFPDNFDSLDNNWRKIEKIQSDKRESYSVASLQQEINLLKEQIENSNSKSSFDIYSSTDEENLKEMIGSDYTESMNGNLLDYNELLVENSKLNKDISDLTTSLRNQQKEFDQLQTSNNSNDQLQTSKYSNNQSDTSNRLSDDSSENLQDNHLLQMEKELDEKNKKLKETENKSKIMKLEYEQQIKSLQTKIKQQSKVSSENNKINQPEINSTFKLQDQLNELEAEMSNNEKIIINARRNASDSSDKKIEKTTAFTKISEAEKEIDRNNEAITKVKQQFKNYQKKSRDKWEFFRACHASLLTKYHHCYVTTARRHA